MGGFFREVNSNLSLKKETLWEGNVGEGSISLGNIDTSDYYAFIIYTGNYYGSSPNISIINIDYPKIAIGVGSPYPFYRSAILSGTTINIGSCSGVGWSDVENYCRTTKVVGIKK